MRRLRADAWVCMSSAQADDCRQHGLPADRVHLIPNGVDCDRFRPAGSPAERSELRERLGLPPGGRCALYIGTIEADKGVDLLVEAGLQLCRADPSFQLLLLGPDGRQPGEAHVVGAYVGKVEERIRAAGLSERIRLLGRRENVDEFLRASDCFVFASRSEGFGTVLVEAMASGTPPVALNLPGVTADIIRHGESGVIVGEESATAFAGAIAGLLGAPRVLERMAHEGRVRAERLFSMGAVAGRYVEVYRGMLGDSPAG
jgi:glycosyltransferase involved in cell wall biosynthesis